MIKRKNLKNRYVKCKRTNLKMITSFMADKSQMTMKKHL